MTLDDNARRVVADRYLLGELIGRGGMGAVYFARHQLTGETVALKLIRPGGVDPQLPLDRFRREVSVAARIGHPGIVRIQDGGQEPNGDIYVVMELLRGRDLHHYMHDEAFELRGGVFVLRSALEPLAAAHRAGIVHRDLKPQNIFLHKAPEGLQIKLLDFGIARDLAATDGLTATNVSLGTPQYISPEQAMQASQVGPPADVWAFGVTLYQMLAGHPPFDGETLFTVLKAACEDRPPELRPSSPLGERLVPVIEACLQKHPDQRPPDAEALAEMLDLALGHSAPASPTRFSPETTQAELTLATPSRSGRRPLALLLFLLAGLAAVAGAELWKARRHPSRPPPATPAPVTESPSKPSLEPVPVPSLQPLPEETPPASEVQPGSSPPSRTRRKARSRGRRPLRRRLNPPMLEAQTGEIPEAPTPEIPLPAAAASPGSVPDIPPPRAGTSEGSPSDVPLPSAERAAEPFPPDKDEPSPESKRVPPRDETEEDKRAPARKPSAPKPGKDSKTKDKRPGFISF